MIPKKKLSDIADIYNGNSINKTVKKQKYMKDVPGWNYIATKDVGFDGNVIYKTGVVIPYSESQFRTAPAGSVFVCSEGGSAGRKTAIIKEEVCFGNKLFAIVNNDNLFIPKYIYYYTRYGEFIKQFKLLASTLMGGITAKNFGKIEVPLPEIEKQERIVSKIEEMFSSLDNAVETLNRTQEQLAVYRQSVLKEVFEKLNGDNTVLGEVIVSKPRNGYSPKGVAYVTPYKNLTLTATTKGFFQEDCFKYIDIDIDAESYLWVKHNDILIQRANTVEYVGISAIYKGDDNKYVYPDLMMKFHIKDGIDPNFILYQLKYSHAIGYYRKRATGTAGSMPKINQTTVMNTPIIMTSLDNQTRIVKELDSKFSLCDSIEKMVANALEESESLRQSIFKEAFEGRLV